MALPQPLKFSATSCAAVAPSSSKELTNSSGPIRLGRRRPNAGILSAGFCDHGHVQYYKSVFGSSAATAAAGRRDVKSEKEKSPKKMKKKQLKLLKGLSRDLSAFSQMGYGIDFDSGLLDEIKRNMITEATQVLLEQLEKVKAEEKELKRKMKEEKGRSKAEAHMQFGGNCKISSSDGECGDMNSLKQTKSGLQQVIEEEIPAYPVPIIPTIPSIKVDNCSCTVMPSSCSNANDLGDGSGSCFGGAACSKKIEVCMGGKCKKSGAGAVLEELRRVVGVENAVTGCKCMGKCRDGPNVKVVNDGVGMEKKSLCIGVGLEDVNGIVATFLADQCHIH